MFTDFIAKKEDKFRNTLSVVQEQVFYWAIEDLEQRTLQNALDPYKMYYDEIYCEDEFIGKRFRIEKQNDNIKIYLDMQTIFHHNRKNDELILRINDSQNYPLKLSYYEITTQINDWGDETGDWLHEWGYEIPLDLLSLICEANQVEDSLNSDFVWQSNAKMIYNQACDENKYEEDFIVFFSRLKKAQEEKKLRRQQEEAEKAAKKQEEEKLRERLKKGEERRRREIEESKKKKAKIWMTVMIIGVLLFVGGISGCAADGGSWLWMSLVGAIAAVVGFIGYIICD